MTDRDTFAAAALTGIIAAADDSEIKEYQARFLAQQAWLVADAMLAARGATDHDAAPAAGSPTLTDVEREALAAQPATWVEEEIACYQAFDRSGAPWDWPDDEPATVTRMSLSMSAECVRLRDEVDRLRLTDAERETLKRAVGWLSTIASQRGDIHTAQYVLDDLDDAATLRGLLARAAKEGR